MVFTLVDRINRHFIIEVSSRDIAGVVSNLEDVWKKVAPGRPFQYSFLDETCGALYRSEQRAGTIFAAFAGLTILIACLGLFGLAAFTTERRTKEIGVRKTLGATVPQIVALLSKDTLKLVFIAAVIAAPLAYFAMRRWLSGFAYRIELGVSVFLLVTLAALAIAFLTVSYRTIRAARANPADALRDE